MWRTQNQDRGQLRGVVGCRLGRVRGIGAGRDIESLVPESIAPTLAVLLVLHGVCNSYDY